MLKNIFHRIKSYFIYFIFRTRLFTRRKAREIASLARDGQRILEIGSGKKNEKNRYYFSNISFFKGKKIDFVMSDLNPRFGHKVIDITKLKEKNRYDHILCFHVLDEVYDWEKGLMNLYRALRKSGRLHLVSPAFVPFSDKVYYRFMDSAFIEFCRRNRIKIEKLEPHGSKGFPLAYYIRMIKE
jgi:ubiquinone/menaquinone biosynthesis C-methylase UbiE